MTKAENWILYGKYSPCTKVTGKGFIIKHTPICCLIFNSSLEMQKKPPCSQKLSKLFSFHKI